MAGLEACFDQLSPDIRQLVQFCAEQVDPLSAGDLGVQIVFLGHLTEHDQLVRRDFATGDARHNRVSAVLLHVRHEGVVGVLQRNQARIGNRLVPAGGENRADCRLADVTAMLTMAVFAQQRLKALDALDADDAVQLLTGVREVFAQALVDFNAASRQFVLEHLLEQRSTTTATGRRLGIGLEFTQISAAGIDLTADRALADVVAGADGRGIRQRISAQRRRALTHRQNQAGRIGRQLDAVQRVLQQGVVIAVVADQHRANHPLAIGRHHQTAVAVVDVIDIAVAARAFGGTVGIANGAHVNAQQLEFG